MFVATVQGDRVAGAVARIVDDHWMPVPAPRSVVVCARDEALARRIMASPGWSGPGAVRAVTSTGDALASLARRPADVVVVDGATIGSHYPSFVRGVLGLSPHAAVVFVGVESPYAVLGALAAGARGVISAGRHGEELAGAVAYALRSAERGPVRPAGPVDGAALSERELEVLRRMSQGLTNAEIGQQLFITQDTVKTHARRLYRKLGVRDRAHAVATALRAGLLS
jgi:DNA-binding NarL/FixJ family response regulator